MEVIASSLYLTDKEREERHKEHGEHVQKYKAWSKSLSKKRSSTVRKHFQSSCQSVLYWAIFGRKRGWIRVYMKKKKKKQNKGTQHIKMTSFKRWVFISCLNKTNKTKDKHSHRGCLDDPPLYNVKNSGRQMIKARITRMRSLVSAALVMAAP